jgi:hypothetical protein
MCRRKASFIRLLERRHARSASSKARSFVSALVVVPRGQAIPRGTHRLSKSFRSAERLVHRARSAGHEHWAFGPRASSLSSFGISTVSGGHQFIGLRRVGRAPGGRRPGTPRFIEGVRQRRLTTRCSGLATLAAELDIVRPHILKTVRVVARRRSFSQGARESESSWRGVSARCFSELIVFPRGKASLLGARPASKSFGAQRGSRIVASVAWHEEKIFGPVLHRSARSSYRPFPERSVHRESWPGSVRRLFVRGRLLSSGEAGWGLTPRCSGLACARR